MPDMDKLGIVRVAARGALMGLMLGLGLSACGDRSKDDGGMASSANKVSSSKPTAESAAPPTKTAKETRFSGNLEPAVEAQDGVPMHGEYSKKDTALVDAAGMCWQDYCPCDPPQGGPDMMICRRLRAGLPTDDELMSLAAGMRDTRDQLEDFEAKHGRW